jgi:hypothetical protein
MNISVTDLLRNKRAYASYFDFRGDQAGTELGVVRNWLSARYCKPTEIYRTIEHRLPPHDPPDVVLVTHAGPRHGFEVTELVDADTTRRFHRNETSDGKEYSEAEFNRLVKERIVAKSQMAFKGGPYERKFCIIYSDEPYICYDTGFSYLRNLRFTLATPFHEIWFMIPPEINISGGAPRNEEHQLFQIDAG